MNLSSDRAFSEPRWRQILCILSWSSPNKEKLWASMSKLGLMYIKRHFALKEEVVSKCKTAMAYWVKWDAGKFTLLCYGHQREGRLQISVSMLSSYATLKPPAFWANVQKSTHPAWQCYSPTPKPRTGVSSKFPHSRVIAAYLAGCPQSRFN
jgi:hypothetical protein